MPMKFSIVLIAAGVSISSLFVACSGGSTENPPAATDTTVNKSDDSNTGKLEANKQLVRDFYQSLMGDKDSTAIDKYIDDNIKEHNPLLQDGKEWLKNTLRPFLENPNIQKTKVDIEQIAAEGDMVWVLVRDTAPNGKVFARVNIFRINNGKITEAWKVTELVPATSANQNTVF
jgi:predicted SnoaL-like aldol condensation-catalyzing enzyme